MTDTPASQNSEPKVVEVTVDGAQPTAATTQNQNNTARVAPDSNATLSALIEANVLNILTEENLATEEEVREKNTQLLSYLAKLIELLKEKTSECVTLEKQNAALTQQSKSLKEVVAIVKDLLNIRNMEVTHLQEDIGSMQEKINNERIRQNTMIEKMERVTQLNDSLKEEYKKQFAVFEDVRVKYEQKVTMLLAENQKLIELRTAAQ